MQHFGLPDVKTPQFTGFTGNEGNSSGPPKKNASTEISNGSAGTAANATVSRIRRRNRMITSCLECRRRKLKCDKSHPCANCTKFSRDCVFLAPALDSASQLKLTEIKEKMGSLERVLEQDVAMKGAQKNTAKAAPSTERTHGEEADFGPEPEDEKGLEPSPLTVIDAMYDDDADDDFMDLGIQLGKLRLTDRIGGYFRPMISDEINEALIDIKDDSKSPNETSGVQARQNLQSFLAPGPTYIAPTSSFFFVGNQGTSLIDFLPSKLAADRLLSQYWYAVYPIARIVHRPSFERRYETFWNEVQMGVEPLGSLQAVIFAAMFSGVVSMSEEIITRDFGASKKALVENFQRGTETALARANFLRTTKIETLQALVMYMIPLCRDQMSRAHSALCGAAIRLAECMGLHRDGTNYGLGPVEIHVRRLIWYQLCFLDIRTCEAQGPRPCIRAKDFDTKFPLNVDDIELELRRPPKKSAERWTDMTCSLIRMECNEMHRQIWVDRPRLEKKQMSLTTVLGKIESFRKSFEERYLPLIDTNVPIQQCARLYMIVLLSRMIIAVLHRYHNSVAVTIPDRLRQIILTSGTEQVEAAMAIETLPSCRPWSWYAGALQQYTTAFLLLVEVFAFPMRKEADRIWRVLDYVFEVPPDLSREQKGRMILTAIRDRSGTYREARKIRIPTTMLERLGQQPSIKAGFYEKERSQTPSSSAAAADHASSSPGSIIHMGPLTSPPAQTPSADGSSDTNEYTEQAPPQPSMSDDLMADIDWNEWDKLFPPNVNTGELNLAPFRH